MKDDNLVLKLDDVESCALTTMIENNLEEYKKKLAEYQKYDDTELFAHSISFNKHRIECCESILDKIYRQRPWCYRSLTKDEALQLCKEYGKHKSKAKAYERAKAIVEAKEKQREEKNSEHTSEKP